MHLDTDEEIGSDKTSHRGSGLGNKTIVSHPGDKAVEERQKVEAPRCRAVMFCSVGFYC